MLKLTRNDWNKQILDLRLNRICKSALCGAIMNRSGGPERGTFLTLEHFEILTTAVGRSIMVSDREYTLTQDERGWVTLDLVQPLPPPSRSHDRTPDANTAPEKATGAHSKSRRPADTALYGGEESF